MDTSLQVEAVAVAVVEATEAVAVAVTEAVAVAATEVEAMINKITAMVEVDTIRWAHLREEEVLVLAAGCLCLEVAYPPGEHPEVGLGVEESLVGEALRHPEAVVPREVAVRHVVPRGVEVAVPRVEALGVAAASKMVVAQEPSHPAVCRSSK